MKGMNRVLVNAEIKPWNPTEKRVSAKVLYAFNVEKRGEEKGVLGCVREALQRVLPKINQVIKTKKLQTLSKSRGAHRKSKGIEILLVGME